MEEMFVIIDCFSGRYYTGLDDEFSVIGSFNFVQYSRYEFAEASLREINVPVGTRLKIEKHYVKQ